MTLPFLDRFRRAPPKERVVLDDGRPVTIVPIGPDAKPLIARAIERVSPESSRRRFFTVRRRFSERELDDLTALDGWHRYAIGAVGHGPDGPLGAAVARFARLPDDPAAAELALLVVDDYQHVGLGRRMLARLALAARERGVERLVGRMLADNDAMLNLLQRHAPGVGIEPAGDHYAIDMPLSAGGWRAALAAA
jgi:GNAT superfamily N-acetyltransferase